MSSLGGPTLKKHFLLKKIWHFCLVGKYVNPIKIWPTLFQKLHHFIKENLNFYLLNRENLQFFNSFSMEMGIGD